MQFPSSTFRKDNPSLLPLFTVLPRIVQNDELMQTIDDQWRRLPMALAVLSEEIDIRYPDLFW